MEIVFLVASILISLIFIYSIGRILYSHKELIETYKDSFPIIVIHSTMGIFMTILSFVVLCALNNTHWYLPYLFV